MSARRARGRRGGGVATVALVAIALGVGLLVGLASPRGTTGSETAATDDADATRLTADLATKNEWVDALAEAAIAGRIEGMRVALVITAGTDPEAVDEVTTALVDGGAEVMTTAHLGAEWWDPAKSSFRGELANQVADTVAGAAGLGATDVLEHAIVQAMVPGAIPAGATDPEAGTDPEAADGIDRQAVLLEVLSRAEVVTIDRPATEGVDAVVIVSGGGPEGAGAAINAAATVWETYIGTSLIVIASDDDAVMKEAVEVGIETPRSTRPSIVAMSAQGPSAARVVLALVEQSFGGTGVYADADEFELIAVP